jgi:hypothetical protein
MELSEKQWAIIDAMANRHEVVVHEPVERGLREGTAVYVAGVNWTGDSTPLISEDLVVWPSGIEECMPR